MNETQILLIVSSTMLVVSLISLFISIRNNKKINTIRDQLFMTLIKCENILKTVNVIDSTDDNLKEDTMNALSYIADTVESLSSSNETVLRKMYAMQQQQAQQQPHRVYPRPQVASEITATIKEQIQMELIKSRKLKAPRADYLNHIIENVSKTYPDISIDYIANKCVAIIESMGSGGGIPRQE
jgi:hypothetical protein